MKKLLLLALSLLTFQGLLSIAPKWYAYDIEKGLANLQKKDALWEGWRFLAFDLETKNHYRKDSTFGLSYASRLTSYNSDLDLTFVKEIEKGNNVRICFYNTKSRQHSYVDSSCKELEEIFYRTEGIKKNYRPNSLETKCPIHDKLFMPKWQDRNLSYDERKKMTNYEISCVPEKDFTCFYTYDSDNKLIIYVDRVNECTSFTETSAYICYDGKTQKWVCKQTESCGIGSAESQIKETFTSQNYYQFKDRGIIADLFNLPEDL